MNSNGWPDLSFRNYRECQPKEQSLLDSTSQFKSIKTHSQWGTLSHCEIRVGVLTKKLKHKSKQSTIFCSRLTLSPSNIKETCFPIISRKTEQQTHQAILKIKEMNERIQNYQEQEHTQLLLFIAGIESKMKDFFEYSNKISDGLMAQLEDMNYLLQRIGERSAKQQGYRRQFMIYSDIFKKTKIQRVSPIKLKKSVKINTVNSMNMDGSLLFSCKKDLEQDQGYITLKYSQDSNILKHKQRSSENISLSQEKSYPKNRFSHKKIQMKDYCKQVETDQQDNSPYDRVVSDKIIISLNDLKSVVCFQRQQAKKAAESYEDLLDKMVQQIAQQKVESQMEWRDIIQNTDLMFNQISMMLVSLKTTSISQSNQIEQHLINMQISVNNNLTIQRKQRQQQQQMSLKMILQIIQTLQ